jgi:murein L,D-transpeptidase YafK
MASFSMPLSWFRPLFLSPNSWPFRHVQKKRVKNAWQKKHQALLGLMSSLQPQSKDPGWLFWVNKRERILEGYFVYHQRPFSPVFVFSLPLTAFSGTLGPKQKEGDGQMPEGWFTVIRLNPESRFHLSMRLDFPRPEDVARAFPDAPGSDIYIHGGASTTGCVAVGDEAVEWLYVLAFWQRCIQKSPLRVGIFSHAAPYGKKRRRKR